MVDFKFEKDNYGGIVVGDYVPMDNTRQTLEEHLAQFIGEPNTEATRRRMQFVIDCWNLVNRDNVRLEDVNIL